MSETLICQTEGCFLEVTDSDFAPYCLICNRDRVERILNKGGVELVVTPSEEGGKAYGVAIDARMMERLTDVTQWRLTHFAEVDGTEVALTDGAFMICAALSAITADATEEAFVRIARRMYRAADGIIGATDDGDPD